MRERAGRDALHDVHNEVSRAGKGIKDVDILFREAGAEMFAQDVLGAGNHEIDERLRGIDDAVGVGHLDAEALEEALIHDVEELLLLGEIVDRLGGMLDGDVEGIERTLKVVAVEAAVGERADDFLDLDGDDVAPHEVADVENLAEDALGEEMLDDHFLDCGFGKVWVQRVAAEGEEGREGGLELRAFLALAADDFREAVADLGDALLEIVRGLFPLLVNWMAPGKEEAEDVDQFFRVAQVGFEKAFAVLIEDGVVRRLEEDVIPRVAGGEFGFDFLFEVVVAVLRFPQAEVKGLGELVEHGTVGDDLLPAFARHAIFRHEHPGDLFRAVVEQCLKCRADRALVLHAEPVELRKRRVIGGDRFVAGFEREDRHVPLGFTGADGSLRVWNDSSR